MSEGEGNLEGPLLGRVPLGLADVVGLDVDGEEGADGVGGVGVLDGGVDDGLVRPVVAVERVQAVPPAFTPLSLSHSTFEHERRERRTRAVDGVDERLSAHVRLQELIRAVLVEDFSLQVAVGIGGEAAKAVR